MPSTLTAVKRPAQNPAPAMGLSRKLATGQGRGLKMRSRTHHNRLAAAITAAYGSRRCQRSRGCPPRKLRSHKSMTAGMTTAFSLANMPAAAMTNSPVAAATNRGPRRVADRMYSNRPLTTAIAAIRSARPTILVTASVASGCTAQSAAAKKKEIAPIIPRQIVAVPQDGVIEEERCRGNGPVGPATRGRPPVVPGENQPQVVRAHLADARVLLQHGAHIENRPRIEGIRIGEQGDRAEARSQEPGALEEPD